jgi:acetolactate synthase I/II/III large subunit
MSLETQIPSGNGRSAGMISHMGRCLNGAESMIRTLIANGIEVCFVNPGTSEMHFVHALDSNPGMRAVLGLFEGVVTGAADGYARMSGKPAATLLHLGPGLANGLANLHNARKAQSPMVNIIGDHATSHQRFDAPLTSDVKGFAETVSHWVASCRSPKTAAADVSRAVQAARVSPGQIASLILPADVAWLPAERPAPPLHFEGAAPAPNQAVEQAVAALRAGGQVAFLLRGEALRGSGLNTAGRVAAATGARLICDTFAPRLERGAGRIPVERLPYRPVAAIALLAGIKTLILVGSQAPVAFFAYPGQPGDLVPLGCKTLVLTHPHEDGPGALEALADAIGARQPGHVSPDEPPARPAEGPLTNEAIMRLIGHHLPEGAIISDESITGGFSDYHLLNNAAQHDHLQLAGGAIGDGLPVATGAAIACPDRKVVALQADGSAMYSLQALWTQAREQLDVVSVIYANGAYKVLLDELKAVGAGEPGSKAFSVLDLHEPPLNWVSLAQGMGVEAVRVDNTRALDDALCAAMAERGPRLIEAVLS